MRHGGRKTAKPFLATALFIAAAAYAQEFKIRAKVDLVVVPVTVKGAGGTLVRVSGRKISSSWKTGVSRP